MMMISDIHSDRRRSQRGFNLVEVLIAIALLGTVLMTILTLFYMGRRNVYSGKQTSVAVSIASHAMEDLSARSKLDVLTAFKATTAVPADDIDIDSTANMATDEYDDSIVRLSTNADDIDVTKNDPKGLLKKWSDEAKARLGQSLVAVVLTPQKPYPVADPLTAANATAMRVRILVRWSEGQRRREVILDSAKAARP
jgi:prepilin-type N-terminal cleavage/methylation domain-containing protein